MIFLAKSFWETFIDIWQLFRGHAAHNLLGKANFNLIKINLGDNILQERERERERGERANKLLSTLKGKPQQKKKKARRRGGNIYLLFKCQQKFRLLNSADVLLEKLKLGGLEDGDGCCKVWSD